MMIVTGFGWMTTKVILYSVLFIRK